MTALAEGVTKPPSKARIRTQKFGTFLSGMIMPNIAAFIAWASSPRSSSKRGGHR